MTTDSREERRAARQRRAPALWKPGAPTAQRAALPQAVPRGWRVRPRLVSGGLAAAILLALIVLFVGDALYVHSIKVGGLRTMRAEEIYALTDVVGLHAFWLDASAIRAGILENPTVADVEVIVGWYPDLLTLIVTEREPALVWEQAGTAVWVDVNGRVMRQREDRPELLRVQAEPVLESVPGPDVGVPIVTGALQLQQLLPAGTPLRFHPDYGLGYDDARGWAVWLGAGAGMAEKLRILDAIAADLDQRELRAAEVFLINPDAPHISTRRRAP